ncbi:endothelin-converting enzyme 1-like isoform X2 [Toxorhynchites rutilus septentrionalis]|nr:endothelin-converting enzyme 1-like isoform X2 [Toxorhynchites rutilus septentrionalis]
MEENPEDKVMATSVEAAHKFKSIGSKLRPLVKSSKDRSCRVFCRRCFILVLLVAVVLLSSTIYVIFQYADTLPNICHSKECLRSAAAFKQNMDLRIDPCEDFYSYVCGNWADDHPRPESHGSYSWYAERQLKIYRNVRAHLETNITRADPKPVAQAKAMYKACLDEAAREKRGFKAVTRYLKEFGLPMIPTLLSSVKTSKQNLKFDWVSSVAKIQRKLVLNVIIGFDIVQDHRNKSRNRLSLEYHYSPGDLDFPAYEWSKLKVKGHNRKDLAVPTDDEGDEDEEDDDSSINLEEMAEDFMEMISAIDPGIEIDKEKMLFLATQFTEFYDRLPDRVEPEGENIGYYKLHELQRITDKYIAPRKPFPIWQRYMEILFAGLPEGIPTAEDELQIDDVDIEYLKKLIDVISRESPAYIELYIWGKVVSFLVTNDFSRAYGEESCTESVHNLMGLAVSYAIADKDFLTETKPRIERMLRDIRTEFDQMVLKTDWMDAYTKYATLEKSKATESLIGFPEWILDIEKLEQHYDGLQVSDSRHLENWVTVVEFLIKDRLRSWRMSTDRIWDMDPTEVNAANLQERNAISIPVAIIQYPFYYLGLEALNYGALGEILGHELTHGFDDSGVHYDKHGNLKRWWSMHTLQEYDDRATCFVQQYSKYYVPEARGFVDGNLTLGENIADNGGLREAFHAYRAYIEKHGPEPILPGFEEFTHEQLLFLSFGNQNCETLPPSASKQILEDEHSPSRFRVQGVLSNMEEFSETFKCPPGSTMNPVDKCRVW